MNTKVSLALLDSLGEAPRQWWFFQEKDVIRIGRSLESDVVIADQYVSRDHVYLTFDDGKWVVTVLSQQGIYHGTRKLFNLTLDSQAAQGFMFRLGANGPLLRFDTDVENSDDKTDTTVFQKTQHKPLLVLDRDRLTSEVRQICDGEEFQRLQASLQKLRSAPAKPRAIESPSHP